MNKRHSYSPADWLEDQRHQPVPEDEDSWRDRMRERRLDGDAVPPHKWSYCPYCGVEAPRPGGHQQGCPAHDKGGSR